MALWHWNENKSRWSFVVDTDKFAGNFERELCAYLVGRYDEGGEHRGEPFAIEYRNDFKNNDPFESLVEFRSDDHGDYVGMAPMALAPSPIDGKYDSVAIFLDSKPTDDKLKILLNRAIEFGRRLNLKIRCRLVEEKTVIQSHEIKFTEDLH